MTHDSESTLASRTTPISDGAAHGVQPFTLTMPVRMAWHPDDGPDERTSAFEINFGGLHRAVGGER